MAGDEKRPGTNSTNQDLTVALKPSAKDLARLERAAEALHSRGLFAEGVFSRALWAEALWLEVQEARVGLTAFERVRAAFRAHGLAALVGSPSFQEALDSLSKTDPAEYRSVLELAADLSPRRNAATDDEIFRAWHFTRRYPFRKMLVDKLLRLERDLQRERKHKKDRERRAFRALIWSGKTRIPEFDEYSDWLRPYKGAGDGAPKTPKELAAQWACFDVTGKRKYALEAVAEYDAARNLLAKKRKARRRADELHLIDVLDRAAAHFSGTNP